MHYTYTETETEFTYNLFVPGVEKENITVKKQGGSVNVIAKNEDFNYRYEVKIRMPINSENIKAKLDLGILKLTIPKPNSLTIPIE